ncbi:MAG: hypothetical protein ACRCXZ_06070 [Patescibacteria group bacterium]
MVVNLDRILYSLLICGVLTNCSYYGIQNAINENMPSSQVQTDVLLSNHQQNLKIEEQVVFDWALKSGESREELLKSFKRFNGKKYPQNQEPHDFLKRFVELTKSETKKSNLEISSIPRIKPQYFAYHFGVPVLVLKSSDYRRYIDETTHGMFIDNIGILMHFDDGVDFNHTILNHELIHSFQWFLINEDRFGSLDRTRKAEKNYSLAVIRLKSEAIAFLLAEPKHLSEISELALYSKLFGEELVSLKQEDIGAMKRIALDIQEISGSGDKAAIAKLIEQLRTLKF